MGRQSTNQDWNHLAQQLCFRDERHMYEVLYEQEHLSVSEIADRINCGTATINRRMHAFGIVKRPRGGARRTASKAQILFYMDQRVVMYLRNRVLAEMIGSSYSKIYGYKRWKAGGSYTGYYLSSQGTLSMEGVRK